MMPRAGRLYDIRFRARPDLGNVRVRVMAADEPTPVTPCGAPTVPIEIISGQIPKSNPDRVLGPGELTTIPPFIADWTPVLGGGE